MLSFPSPNTCADGDVRRHQVRPDGGAAWNIQWLISSSCVEHVCPNQDSAGPTNLLPPKQLKISLERRADVTLCSSLQVIFSACELGVFDLLLKSQEPLSARHVARELSTSVDGMERLLDALVGIEILEVETTNRTGEMEEELKGGQDGTDVWLFISVQILNTYGQNMAPIVDSHTRVCIYMNINVCTYYNKFIDHFYSLTMTIWPFCHSLFLLSLYFLFTQPCRCY